MEGNLPPSQPPVQPVPLQPFPAPLTGVSAEALEQLLRPMKARAMEEAVRMTLEQRGGSAPAPQPSQVPPPNVVYVRRNLTVAELLLTLLLACGLVTGVQVGWNVVSNFIPHIEVKVK